MAVITDKEIEDLTLPAKPGPEFTTPPNNYVDRDRLLQTLITWKNLRVLSDDPDKDLSIPPYVAESILKIAKGVADRRQFRNNPYKEEMVGNAVLNCVRYIKNFDPEAPTRSGKPNPFGYITQIVKFAFWDYIRVEAKEEYVALLQFEEAGGFMATEGEQHVHQQTVTAEGNEITMDHYNRLEALRDRFKSTAKPKKKAPEIKPDGVLSRLFVQTEEEPEQDNTCEDKKEVKIW